jgi:hypothetical protein
MATSPNCALSYVVASQAQKETTVNDSLNDLDALTQACVISRALATPPASPSDGDAYIVASTPTGAWSDQVDALAIYYSGWRFKTPQVGWRVWSRAEAKVYYYTGSAWALLAAPVLETTFAWTPGAVATAGGVSSSAVTLSGAAFGDYVQVAAPYSLAGVSACAYVSAADTVQVRLSNLTGSAVTLAAGTWRVRIAKA